LTEKVGRIFKYQTAFYKWILRNNSLPDYRLIKRKAGRASKSALKIQSLREWGAQSVWYFLFNADLKALLTTTKKKVQLFSCTSDNYESKSYFIRFNFFISPDFRLSAFFLWMMLRLASLSIIATVSGSIFFSFFQSSYRSKISYRITGGFTEIPVVFPSFFRLGDRLSVHSWYWPLNSF
jgi:hypothetical protein